MTEFIETVWMEMGKGNFSFLILIVGVAQLVVMFRNKHYNKQHFKRHFDEGQHIGNDKDRL